MTHQCRWARDTTYYYEEREMYKIRYSNGQPTQTADTFDAAIEILQAEYPDLEYGHDGDLSDGGDRTLCWESEEDSVNDDGANAVASIRVK